MPKKIINLESRLLEEARKQTAENGYGATTIRSVATACGVGVGTVYNYFESKEELVASFMLADWKRCVDTINAVSAYSDGPLPVVRCICDQLIAYSRQYESIFRDEAASSAFSGFFSRYHAVLRGQLSEPLRKFCSDDFTSQFIAEALLTWTTAGKSCEEIYGIIGKLF